MGKKTIYSQQFSHLWIESLQISLQLRKNIENGKTAVCILEIFSLTALEIFKMVITKLHCTNLDDFKSARRLAIHTYLWRRGSNQLRRGTGEI